MAKKGGKRMIGARLADLRDWNNQTQEELAKALNVATSTIRSWKHEKSSPNHEMLIAICRYYGTSADYLLGLTDIDPSDEARKQRQRLTCSPRSSPLSAWTLRPPLRMRAASSMC